MRDLPTGTVTFLFTDIEGSTNLARDLGPRWGEALEAHQRLLRRAAVEAGRSLSPQDAIAEALAIEVE